MAGGNYDLPPARNIFVHYADLGGGETGDKDTDWKSRFLILDFEKLNFAIGVLTIDMTKKSSSNSTWSNRL